MLLGRRGVRPHSYHPALLVKVLVLSYLFNLSERQTEEFVRYNLAARYFVDMGVVRRYRTTTNKVFHGYKAHLSLDAHSWIITSVVVASGDKPDEKQLGRLLEKDQEVGVEAEVYAGDKGYDDGENHEFLRVLGKKSALCLKGYRTKKRDANKGLWVQIKESEEYKEGQGERYKIEQKNGGSKRRHGLGRCRYLGLAKYAVQSILVAMVMNLKRMVRLLCGVGMGKALRPAA